jgi:hypothetical protein
MVRINFSWAIVLLMALNGCGRPSAECIRASASSTPPAGPPPEQTEPTSPLPPTPGELPGGDRR